MTRIRLAKHNVQQCEGSCNVRSKLSAQYPILDDIFLSKHRLAKMVIA